MENKNILTVDGFNLPEYEGNSQFEELTSYLMGIMRKQANAERKIPSLLNGDPGTGKTESIKLFSKLLGIPIVVVEAPHITEENLSAIPFMVENDDKNSKMAYKIQNSKPQLISELETLNKLSDEEHLKVIKGDLILENLYNKYEKEIINIRNKYGYERILFLDEYFRQTPDNVRSMLRTILENKIGGKEIPKGTFVQLATNLNDTGLEKIPSNVEYSDFFYETPDVNSWFLYMYQYNKEALNPQIFNNFQNILNNNNFNFDDGVVRISPRRWTQMLLTISSGIKNIEDINDASALLTIINDQFNNIYDKSTTPEREVLRTQILKFVSDNIKEQKGIDIQYKNLLPANEWEQLMMFQLKIKLDLGDKRKYVPVIAGLPGIGKTMFGKTASKKLDINQVNINCSNLNIDDLTGIPMKDKDGNVSFSKPKLYEEIMSQIKNPSKKTIIIMDEINRTKNINFFNGVRKLLLDKEFANPEYNLKSDNFIFIGAINPDIPKNEGVKLTNHMLDVLDIVEANPNYKTLEQYIKNDNTNIKDLSSDSKISNLNEIVFDISDKILEHFNPKIDSELSKFYLEIDNQRIYVSPRVINDICEDFTDKLTENNTEKLLLTYTKTNDDKIKNQILTEISLKLGESFHRTISYALRQNDLEPKEYKQDILNYFYEKEFKNILQEQLFTTTGKTLSLKNVFDTIYEKPELLLKDKMLYTQVNDSLQTYLKSPVELHNLFHYTIINKFAKDIDADNFISLSNDDKEEVKNNIKSQFKDASKNENLEEFYKFLDKQETMLNFTENVLNALKKNDFSKDITIQISNSINSFQNDLTGSVVLKSKINKLLDNPENIELAKKMYKILEKDNAIKNFETPNNIGIDLQDNNIYIKAKQILIDNNLLDEINNKKGIALPSSLVNKKVKDLNKQKKNDVGEPK